MITINFDNQLKVDLEDKTFEKIKNTEIISKSFLLKIKSKPKITEVEEEEVKKEKSGVDKNELDMKKKINPIKKEKSEKKKEEKKVATPMSSTTISNAKQKKIAKGKEVVKDKGIDEANSDSKT